MPLKFWPPPIGVVWLHAWLFQFRAAFLSLAPISAKGYYPLYKAVLLTLLQVTWYVPIVDDAGSRSRHPHLTKVTRLQRFLTYLVVHSANLPSSPLLSESCHLHVLKAVSWSVEVTINVDPMKPVGERVTFVGPARQCDPEVIDVTDAPSLTENAVQPPNANSSQTLIWWPADTNEEPVVIVKPLLPTPSIMKALQTYQHSHSQHALRLQSLYCFSPKH